MYDRFDNRNRFSDCNNEYNKFKRMIDKLHYGEDVNYDVPWLKKKIQQSYEEGRLQSGQYDDLMRMLEDIDF